MNRFASALIFAACAASLILTSCSAKESSTKTNEDQLRPAPAVNFHPQKHAVDNRPLIIAFGDSLTSGVVEHTYPQYLQELIDQHGLRFRVENQGVAGDTTADGLARIDNVTAERPAMVLLEFGGNDGLRGVPVQTTKQNLEDMIQRLKTTGTGIMLIGITLPPNYGPEYIRSFNAIYTDLARKYHLPLLPFLLEHVYNVNGMMQPDGIHPSDAGNKIVAQDVFHFIEPQLKRLSTQ